MDELRRLLGLGSIHLLGSGIIRQRAMGIIRHRALGNIRLQASESTRGQDLGIIRHRASTRRHQHRRGLCLRTRRRLVSPRQTTPRLPGRLLLHQKALCRRTRRRGRLMHRREPRTRRLRGHRRRSARP